MRGEGGRRPPGVVAVPSSGRPGLRGGYLALGWLPPGGGRRERRAEEARAVVLPGAVLLAGVRFSAVSLAGVRRSAVSLAGVRRSAVSLAGDRFSGVSFADTLCSGGPLVSICSAGAGTGEAGDSSGCTGRPATVGSGCVSGSFSAAAGSGVELRAACEPRVNHRAGAGAVGGSPERGRELSGGMEADLLIPFICHWDKAN